MYDNTFLAISLPSIEPPLYDDTLEIYENPLKKLKNKSQYQTYMVEKIINNYDV